ncbi:hypothetical protein Are01nite_79760 [Actinoplanes regularis]|nr:hypothetical protein Are01nite_79760 [Actinoplanes regularis]
MLTDLGVRVGRQWAEEAKRREVIRPAPVMVRWSSTGRPSASRQVVLDNESGPGWQEMPLRGRFDPINEEIVAALRGLPHQQLVVLGTSLNGRVISRPPFSSMYWTPAQMLAHMTANGASIRPGDLYASGPVSGPELDQRGSLMS